MTTRSDILEHFGITETNSGAYGGRWLETSGPVFESVDPSTGQVLATVTGASLDEYDAVVEAATEAFDRWRMLPAPQRGEYVRRIGNARRQHFGIAFDPHKNSAAIGIGHGHHVPQNGVQAPAAMPVR